MPATLTTLYKTKYHFIADWCFHPGVLSGRLMHCALGGDSPTKRLRMYAILTNISVVLRGCT